jgi:hypothetical protein
VTATESLRKFVDALERVGIPYMLTGSYASSFHSLPRATRDLDFVISPTREQIRALVAALPKDEFYVDERAALEALNGHGQFNAIDTITGWKADFIIRKPRSFSTSEFERRYRATLDGVELTIATAEDVVLAKLEWAKLGSSDRQIEDAATVLRARAPHLDWDYLDRWTRHLGVEIQWRAALDAARIAP